MPDIPSALWSCQRRCLQMVTAFETPPQAPPILLRGEMSTSFPGMSSGTRDQGAPTWGWCLAQSCPIQGGAVESVVHVWQIGALAPLQEAREGNLEYISSISSPEMQRLIKGRDEDGRSLLHSAVSGGSAALVDYLIQNGAAGDVNSADDEVQPVVVLSALGLYEGSTCINKQTWTAPYKFPPQPQSVACRAGRQFIQQSAQVTMPRAPTMTLRCSRSAACSF